MGGRHWVPERMGYAYPGLSFSPDGARLLKEGRVCNELSGVSPARRRLLFVGVPMVSAILLVQLFRDQPESLREGGVLGLGLLLMLGLYLFWNRVLHRCPRCRKPMQVHVSGRHGAPALHLCEACGVFMEGAPEDLEGGG